VGFRKLNERTVHAGPLVSVVEVRAAGPEGEPIEREIVRHPGAVVVVPVAGSEVLLVRQYRVAVDAELLELPAGKRDVSGEEPEQTAARELREEVGVRSGRIEKLAEFYNSPGFCDEHSFLYLARDLEEVASEPQGVEESHMSVVRVGLRESLALVLSGQILDAKTIAGLSLAREILS
jgi:ADP-ribose pyrophosphatase